MTNDDVKNLRILDAVSHEAALEYAANGPMTPELRRDVRAISAVVQDRLAAMRRAEMQRRLAEMSTLASPAVRASIMAMTRDAIVARLAELFTTQPRALLAHRNFATMTETDLQSALEDAETALARSR